jgi:hypothetical protein
LNDPLDVDGNLNIWERVLEGGGVMPNMHCYVKAVKGSILNILVSFFLHLWRNEENKKKVQDIFFPVRARMRIKYFFLCGLTWHFSPFLCDVEITVINCMWVNVLTIQAYDASNLAYDRTLVRLLFVYTVQPVTTNSLGTGKK